jgi:hypothetical protein
MPLFLFNIIPGTIICLAAHIAPASQSNHARSAWEAVLNT